MAVFKKAKGVPVPKCLKQCPVVFDGELKSQTAIIDFKGKRTIDQEFVWGAICSATGLTFKKMYQEGRKIVLEFSWTDPRTVLSFLRELMGKFGYVPEAVTVA